MDSSYNEDETKDYFFGSQQYSGDIYDSFESSFNIKDAFLEESFMDDTLSLKESFDSKLDNSFLSYSNDDNNDDDNQKNNFNYISDIKFSLIKSNNTFDKKEFICHNDIILDSESSESSNISFFKKNKKRKKNSKFFEIFE